MAMINLNFPLTDPNDEVPMVIDWATAIPEINGVMSWNVARASGVILDGNSKAIQMLDMSGNANVFDQTTTDTRRPLWQSNRLNGHSSLTFSSADETGMLWDGVFPVGADHTKVAVVKASSITGTHNILSSTYSEKSALYIDTYEYVRAANGSSVVSLADGGKTVVDEWFLIIASLDDATGTTKISMNGEAALSAPTGGGETTRTDMFLGTGNNLYSGGFDGEIAFTAIFSTDLLDPSNQSELDFVKQFVRDVFALDVS